MTKCFEKSKYAQDVKLENMLMTSILNRRFVHILGVGNGINVTFTNRLINIQNRGLAKKEKAMTMSSLKKTYNMIQNSV